MYEGKIVFAQLMEHLPLHTLRRCIERFDGDRSVKGFSCQDQFRCMAFVQLTYRDSLRDTVTCLNAQGPKLYHMGLRGAVRRSTLADANEKRDWRLYQAFAAALIVQARRLYANEPLGVDLDSTAYALDTTTIDLCLSLFPWAPFQATKAALKLHTMMDLRGNIPLLVHIDDGKSYDTDILDVLTPEPGAVYIMDRGYLDFARLHRLTEGGAFFIVRTGVTSAGVVSHRGPSTTPPASSAIRSCASPGATRPGSIPTACGASATPIPRPARPWLSSPTTSRCPPAPSPISTAAAGKSSCSSSGSSSTCASSRSSASPRTR
jgi:hypothetical protein